MAINYQSDEICFHFLKKEFVGYSRSTLRSDAIAAIAVALMTVPQAMAYAILAGLPVSCGVFAAIYSSFITALVGSSRHLIVGPSNAIAILVQACTSEILFSHYREIAAADRDLMAVLILTQLTLLIGMFQVIAAGLKLGRLIQFVSHSVVVGYVLGTVGAVVINQLFVFLGIPRLQGAHSLYELGTYLVTHMQQIHLPTALVGMLSLVLLMTLKRINKRMPAALITLILSGVFVYLTDLTSFQSNFSFFDPYTDAEPQAILLIKDRGLLAEIIPYFSLPYFNMRDINALMPYAFALSILSIMESSFAAKAIAARSGQRLSYNQEMLGLGLGNLVSSLIGAMPISGNPSRTYINYSNGAQTRVSALLTVFFVISILFAFNEFFSLIPLAALAALLLLNVFSIVDSKQTLLCLKATKSDAFVLVVTFISCFFFSFDVAFYIGVIISLILFLKKSALPQLVEFEVDEHGELINIDYCPIHNHRRIRVIKVEGELFFGAADLFQSTLKAIAEDDNYTKVIVLQLKNARDMDATACLALRQLNDYLRGSGRYLILAGITHQIWEVLNDSGIIDELGKENLFVFDERHPHQYMQKAFNHARTLCSAVLVKEVKGEELIPLGELAPSETT